MALLQEGLISLLLCIVIYVGVFLDLLLESKQNVIIVADETRGTSVWVFFIIRDVINILAFEQSLMTEKKHRLNSEIFFLINWRFPKIFAIVFMKSLDFFLHLFFLINSLHVIIWKVVAPLLIVNVLQTTYYLTFLRSKFSKWAYSFSSS